MISDDSRFMIPMLIFQEYFLGLFVQVASETSACVLINFPARVQGSPNPERSPEEELPLKKLLKV